ncbi:fungal-specific transcription factor domain-containing protein [Xylariales sp. PMI_506]|nr:fungal-specific transcription factor domain-containing protein [Xylariales sp. PMI_506]
MTQVQHSVTRLLCQDEKLIPTSVGLNGRKVRPMGLAQAGLGRDHADQQWDDGSYCCLDSSPKRTYGTAHHAQLPLPRSYPHSHPPIISRPNPVFPAIHQTRVQLSAAFQARQALARHLSGLAMSPPTQHRDPSLPLSPHPTSPTPQVFYACITCVQRKVKCDKQQPCLACTKSHLQCRYRETPPPQRRRRKIVQTARAAAGEALLSRVRNYEELLRTAGISFEAMPPGPDTSGASHNAPSNDDCDEDEMDEGAQVDMPSIDRFQGQAQSGHRPQIQNNVHKDLLQQDVLPSSHSNHPMEPANIPALSSTTISSDRESQNPLFPRQRGVLIPEHGGSRYYEHGLIGSLAQKYKQADPSIYSAQEQEQHRQSIDMVPGSLLTPDATPREGSSDPQFSPYIITQCWHSFLENVHPLTKIIHAPTVNRLLEAIAHGNKSNIPKTTKALLFAICACAISSLSDHQCQHSFGQAQAPLLQVWQTAAKQALQETYFLQVPNLDLLRAHMLLVTSMLRNANRPALWTMMGSVMRMARSQGLHRDGAALGLSPFESEMRRRLWWYIITLDGRFTEIMGAESVLPRSVDTLLPSNTDDIDLSPDMTAPPPNRYGASEMIFCLLKYETTQFLLQRDPRTDSPASMRSSPLPPTTGQPARKSDDEDKRQTVHTLERRLEDKFLRFCDPLVPLHLLTTATARSLICKLRHMEHRGLAQLRRLQPFDPAMERENNRKILHFASRNNSYDNLIHSNPAFAGFLWHVDFFFPWGAPIFVLKILASSRSAAEWDDESEAAWAQIEQLYQHHPEFAAPGTRVPEHLIVGDLTLKAWTARELALQERRGEGRHPALQYEQKLAVPPFIEALRVQSRNATRMSHGADRDCDYLNDGNIRLTTSKTTDDVSPSASIGMSEINNIFDSNSFGFIDGVFNEADWADWNFSRKAKALPLHNEKFRNRDIMRSYMPPLRVLPSLDSPAVASYWLSIGCKRSSFANSTVTSWHSIAKTSEKGKGDRVRLTMNHSSRSGFD